MPSKNRVPKAEVLRAARLKSPAHHFPKSEPHEVCPNFSLNAREREGLMRLLEYGIEGSDRPLRKASGETLDIYEALYARLTLDSTSAHRHLVEESNRVWKAVKLEGKKLAEKKSMK